MTRTDAPALAMVRRSHTPAGVLVSAGIFAVLVLAALFPGLFTSADPYANSLADTLLPPSSAHWFGTDQLGRDLYTRVVYGVRESLIIGFGATILATIGGILIGSIAGFSGALVDRVISRALDVLFAFPEFLIALLTIAVLGPGEWNIVWAMGIGQIAGKARLMRAEVLSARSAEFTRAAAGLGLRRPTLLVRHVIPNSLGPLLVTSVIGIGTSILFGAGLSFLGLGAQAPTPEWGLMLSQARQYLGVSWWPAVWPGLSITVTVVVITTLGQWLQRRYVTRRELP